MVKNNIVLILLLNGLMLLNGCGKKELKSQWTDNAVTVDGKYTEWEGFPQCFKKFFLIFPLQQ